MKKFVNIILSASALLLSIAPAMAQQDFATGYFLGGYQYAYRLNPAFQSERGFFTVGLGATGLSSASEMGITDFLYVKDGKTVLFMNNKVSSSEFLGNINTEGENLNLGINLNILSSGSWNKEKTTFTTFDINLRSANDIDLPYDLFRFLKDGASNGTTFDLSGTGLHSKNYLEIAYGISRNFNNFLNFGVRVKGLVGLADVNMEMEKLQMTLSGDKWQFQGQGTLKASSAALDIKTKADGTYDYSTIGLPNPYTSKLSAVGLGGALDAGISVNLLPWITVSAALLDFGVMRWNHEIMGATDSAGYTWDPSTGEEVDLMGGSGSDMSSEVDAIKDALSNIYQFKATAAQTDAKFETIPFRVNAGLEIRVPFYQRLSVGALYTHQNLKDFSALTNLNTNNLRFSANWTPLNFLSASVSTTMSNLFKSYGAALNFHPALINLFVGIDCIPQNTISVGPLLNDVLPAAVQPYSKYLQVPSDNLNINAYIGFNLAFGKRQLDYRKMSRQIIKEKKEKEEAKAAEKKEKEEQKAKDKELKEYEKLQAQEAKEAEKQAKEAEKAAKAQAKEDAKAAKEAEKEAKAQAKAEQQAAKEAAAQAKADAKAAKEAEKAAKAQAKADKAAAKAAEQNAALEAKAAQFETEKAKLEEAPAEEVVEEAETTVEELLENAVSPETETPAEEETPKEETEASAPAVPEIFEIPNL